MNNGNKNITTDIWLIDTITDETIRFDSKNQCAVALGIRTNVIDVYLNKERKYKKRFIIKSGEVHAKKVSIKINLNPELYNELKQITKTVESANLMKLTNAICKDFVFRYENNI